MRFADPVWLLLLLLLPLLGFVRWRYRQTSALAFPSLQGMATMVGPLTQWLRRLLSVLRYLVLALAVVALARPQWGIQATKVFREGIAISVLVDISGSMLAQDLKLDGKASDRLAVVKHTLHGFIEGDRQQQQQQQQEQQGREGDMISLSTFARYTDELSSLTLDHAALLKLLEQVEIVSLAEEDGTAIGDAILIGVEALRGSGGASKVIILMTDGSNTAGDTEPLTGAVAARALGIKIYTIGTGTRGMALMPARKRGGGTELRPAPVYIDDDGLTAIAEMTGGRYFRATDSEALGEIYAEIDRLEKSRNVVESFQQYVDGFPLLLGAALLLLLLETLLVNTRLRTLP